MANKIYGIDLGTTYSAIAHVDETGRPVIIKNKEGDNTTPSVVYFEDTGNIIVGKTAREESLVNSNQTVRFVKRAIGNDKWIYRYDDKDYSPAEISSFILKKLVQDAEQTIGEKIEDVVITCPAYFGVDEIQITINAGEIAGLNVRTIIKEPVAAAYAYEKTKSNDSKVFLVYDLGGGTFDCTLIKVEPKKIEVICTGGDPKLGGKDWDDTIISFMNEKYQEETNTDEEIEDPETIQELFEKAESAKRSLSSKERVTIIFNHDGIKVKAELTRDEFEDRSSLHLEKTMSCINAMLDKAREKEKNVIDFDEILLVGGSVRMPMIENRLKSQFPDTKIHIFEPDEAVAKGAAYVGHKIFLEEELEKIIEPAIQRDETSSDIEKIRVDAINEVAKQHNISPLTLKQTIDKEISIVNSKSFGVIATDNEIGEEVVYNLIIRNTKLPVETTQNFYTQEDNQENVLVEITESESYDTTTQKDYCTIIGKSVLKSLPPGLKAGSPIQVTFRLDQEGRLDTKAFEPSNQVEVSASIETQSVLKGKELEDAKSKCTGMTVS